jgi:hypothetical protein
MPDGTDDTNPKQGAPISVIDSPHAPFIFYEGAPALGFTNGVVSHRRLTELALPMS